MEPRVTSPIASPPMPARSRRLRGLVQSVLLAAACTSADGIEEVTSASWAGEIASTNTMMLMTVAQRGTTLSGSGGFTALLVPGSAQSYTITGTLRADTLDIVLKNSGASIRFLGWYLPGKTVITGHLTGGDYYGAQVNLRKQ